MKLYDGSGLVDARDSTAVHRVVSLLNGAWPWSDGLFKSNPELRKHAQKAFTESLRSLVNQWIDSGKDIDGVETPTKRSVSKTPPGYKRSLRDILRDWYDRRAPGTDVDDRTGEDVIIIREPSPSERIALMDEDWPAGRLMADAYEMAIYWLHKLLNSAGSYRVARCQNAECRSPYYVRERMRREPIKRGTYCQNCANVGSITRVQASRERRREALINSAADVWDGYKPSRQYPRKSDWVALQVTKRTDWDIRGKWVTQNQQVIEAEVERRKHGAV
jgi:hypothetical protein